MKVISNALITLCLAVATLALGVGVVAGVANTPSALAVDCSSVTSPAEKVRCGVGSISDDEGSTTTGSAVTALLNAFLFVIGALAVVILIFGGFKYITSSGDSAKVTEAKNTIMYAVIGVVVTVLSYAIVRFASTLFD